MKTNRQIALILSLTALAAGLLAAQNYRKAGSVQIGGTGGWDYLTADAGTHRLYVSHGPEVVVIDLETNKVVGKITGLHGVHGIALADDLNTGFISDGGANQVVLFDLKTLEVKKKVPAGSNPDAILYDSVSQRVFAFNGRSGNATAINATNGTVDSTIVLGGKPEFAVSDGKGNVYDNLEDKSEIVEMDAKSLQVKAHWSIAPCESPSGLAIDTAQRRLFAACDNKMMAVVNADSGKVVATPPIGEGPDAASFDPETKLAFSSNGEGTLTVIHQTGKDTYSVLENAPTVKGARTMALDTATHKIYLSSAEYGPAPAASAGHPHPRPSVVPGTFRVLIMAQ